MSSGSTRRHSPGRWPDSRSSASSPSSAGPLAQFIAWIGAVLNTSRLDDKTWFIVLLVLGLFSFGFIAMLVYLFAGPDGTRESAKQTHPLGATA